MGWGGVLISLGDCVVEVLVKGIRGCLYEICFVFGADEGEFAVITCPEAKQRKNDGGVEYAVVMDVKEDSGEFLVVVLLAH